MHPAFSVILFSTLSGAGYGVLVWVSCAFIAGAASARSLLWWLLAGLLLATVGLLSSLAHLGKPLRAWRAFSQWQTSWLSREGVMALLTYVPALALALALLPQQLDGSGIAPVARASRWALAAALATSVCALLTVVCTAMIYASLKPIPAWRHGLVVPGYLLLSLLSGAVVVAPALAPTQRIAIAAALAVLALAAVALKATYWHAIDTRGLPVTRGEAIGLPDRVPSVFERPHTEANYLTREMGFVLARKHARPLRWIATLLFGVTPVIAALLAWLWPSLAVAVFAVTALPVLVGLLVERWLFFAQAKHLVSLYY